CEEEYERPDVMHSHKHQGAICSLCKSMEESGRQADVTSACFRMR
ncbi:hypothetical protein OFM36_31925, partial [Escherichia coli]|nr:hypothetical protein [Escherichia coli]